MPFCTRCGRNNPDDARFCAGCGSALETAAPPPREVRKTVSVVFCDVTGSTSLGEQLDPESVRRVMGRYFDVMSSALERHGGTVEKFIGDAVMAVFGIPVVHEDDAVRALRAAEEMRVGLAELNRDLDREWGVSIQVRIGVNTGEVVTANASGGQKLVTGDAVNVAARLEQAAGPGEVLLGRATYLLARDAVEVEPAEELELKGKSRPVPAYRLVRVLPGALGHARRLDSPIVGRGHERALLQEAYARAARQGACHLFTVLGTPGVGKSRLVGELVANVRGEATVLTGRCLSYGEDTFWPLAEAIRDATGLDYASSGQVEERIAALLERDAYAARLADLVAQLGGFKPASAPPDETFWAVRKLFESLARRRPLVLVFDDVHWAAPAFLDLVEHVADWSRDAPILLLCVARPDLLDARPAWGGGKVNATSVLLEPLDDRECERLILNLLGDLEYPDEVRHRVTEAAEGIPLFVEELVSMLVEDGVLRRRNGAWVASTDLESIEMPPTITALLAARIERLDEQDRLLLERASVEGKVFHLGALRELSPDAERGELGARLLTLVRRELVRPDRPSFADEDAFRFRNVLIRDAAYRRMPKESRADLHEAFAGWLERKAGERTTEYEEIVAYHLEQAFRYEQEIGLIDSEEATLATRAAEKLSSAGQRALARGDVPAAANLLGRAVSLFTDGGTPPRSDLLLAYGEALRATGELARAQAVLSDALKAAAESGDRRLEAHALIEGLLLETLIDPEFETEQLLEAARETIGVLEELGDDRGLAKAWRGVAEVHGTVCQWAAAADALERALRHAEAIGDEREQTLARTHLANALYWGPTPVAEGVRRCREILEHAGEHRTVEANILCYVAGFGAMIGDFEAAWAGARRARRIFEDVGHLYGLAAHVLVTGSVALLEGDATAAERELRPSFELLDGMGEKAILCSVAALLAEALYRLGEDDQAERFAQASEDAAVADDVATQVMWRATLSKVLARRGELGQAESLVRQALALAEGTDFLNLQGDTLLASADVLRAADRHADAARSAADALERFERKGNLTSARVAQGLLGELQVVR